MLLLLNNNKPRERIRAAAGENYYHNGNQTSFSDVFHNYIKPNSKSINFQKIVTAGKGLDAIFRGITYSKKGKWKTWYTEDGVNALLDEVGIKENMVSVAMRPIASFGLSITSNEREDVFNSDIRMHTLIYKHFKETFKQGMYTLETYSTISKKGNTNVDLILDRNGGSLGFNIRGKYINSGFEEGSSTIGISNYTFGSNGMNKISFDYYNGQNGFTLTFNYGSLQSGFQHAMESLSKARWREASWGLVPLPWGLAPAL